MNKEGKVYTILFITALVVFVGASLAFVATALKPQQDENLKKEKMINILNSFLLSSPLQYLFKKFLANSSTPNLLVISFFSLNTV